MYNQYNNMGMFQNVPKRGINWGNILNNTQRALGIINQVIPIVYQVRPLVNNARTLFKIAGAVSDNSEEVNSSMENDYSNINKL